MNKSRGGYAGIIIIFVLIVGLVTVFLITQLKTYFPNNAATKPRQSSAWGYSAEIINDKSVVWAAPIVPADSLTVEAWVKLEDFTTETLEKRYVVMQGNQNNNVMLSLWISGNVNTEAGKLGIVNALVWGSSVPLTLKSNAIVTTNFWHHVALSKDSTTVRLFLDGKLVASGQISGSTPFSNPVGLAIGAYLKSSPTSVDAVDELHGQIDDLRISDIVLYLRDFSPPKDPLVAQTGTIGLWNFNIKNCLASTCFYPDVTGNGHDGQIIGSINSQPSTIQAIPTYKTCRNSSCAIVSGIGTNSCTTDVDCQH